MVFVYARPDADTSTGSWKNNLGGAALFSSIDETAVDDSDYIVSAPNTFNDATKISLSNVGIAGDPSTVRYRYRKYEGAASDVIDLHVKLLQGTTVIAAWDHSNIGTSFTTVDQALTTPQFQSITDFRDLYLSFTTGAWWLDNSSVDLDFQNGRTWDGSAPGTDFTAFLSCTRASTGYAKTVAGTLTSFATNTLRVTDSGLLCEDARTNIKPASQDFADTGNWNNSNLTITANATAAPDGTATADSLIPTAVSGGHEVSATAGSGTVAKWTFSCYYKPFGYNYGTMGIQTGGGGTVDSVWVIDLVNGIFTDQDNFGSAPTGLTTSVEMLANGWVRAIITLDATTGNLAMKIGALNAATLANFTGDGSSGIYIWGAQVEAGAFVSSYIPTTSTAATRAADNITTSSTLQTVINAATASLVAQTDNGSAAGIAANIVDSNGTNLLGFNASNNALASITATLATGNTANRTTQDKLGLAWSGVGRSLVLNGGTVVTDATAQTPSATQHIGSSGSANFAYAYVERLTGWTTKLADATLQGFTT